nr:hypothetical protein [uncultured Flavobacterium sp.]
MDNNKTNALGGAGSGNYKDKFCDNNCIECLGGAGNDISCGTKIQATLPSGLQTTLRYCKKHGWIGGGGGCFIANGIGESWRASGGGGSGQNQY